MPSPQRLSLRLGFNCPVSSPASTGFVVFSGPALDPALALVERSGATQIRGIAMVDTNSVAAGELKAFIERIERLEEEKKALAGDLRDVYTEAKSQGFDTKVMRKIVALRRRDHAERKEEEAIMELYLEALGMQA